MSLTNLSTIFITRFFLFKNKTTPKAMNKQPPNFKLDLLPHQLDCIDMMQTLEMKEVLKNNNNIYTNQGVLAECPGSGKSLVALGLIENTKNIACKKYKLTRGSFGFYKSVVNKIYIDASLIVCAEHLKTHWENQFKLTGLKYHIIQFPREYIQYCYDYDVILMCSNRLKEKYFYNCIFKRVILDDADILPRGVKNLPEGYFTWYITSYYNNFLNVFNYYPDFRTVIPEELEYIQIKTDLYTPVLPEMYFFDYFYFQDNHSVICKKDLLKSIKNKNYLSAVTQLGGQVVSQEKMNEILEEEYRENNRQDSERYKNIKETVLNYKDNICGICLDENENPIMVMCCNSFYCVDCLVNSFVYTDFKCPHCRTNKPDTLLLTDKQVPPLPDKLSTVVDIVFSNSGSFVVYTKDIRFCKYIQRELWRAKIICNTIHDKKDKDMRFILELFCNPTEMNRKRVLLLNGDPPCGIRLDNVDNLVIDSESNWSLIRDDICKISTEPKKLKVHVLNKTI